MEEYIKKNDDKTINFIPDGYHQVFYNPLSVKINEVEILKLRDSNSSCVTDEDIDFLEFLFRVRFASYKDIIEYLEVATGKTQKESNIMIERLIRNHLINKFYLSRTEEYKKVKFPMDSMNIFCLDSGGMYLLKAFSSVDVYDWTTARIRASSAIVGKTMMATSFYMKVLKDCDNNVEFFKHTMRYFVGSENFTTCFHFCIKEPADPETTETGRDFTRKYFIGEVFRSDESEDINEKREKLRHLESLMCTNAWKKYYPDSKEGPILLIIAETDEIALEISREITIATTKLTRFRVSTNERINTIKLYEKGAFQKYDDTKGEMVDIKVSTFKKKKEE